MNDLPNKTRKSMTSPSPQHGSLLPTSSSSSRRRQRFLMGLFMTLYRTTTTTCHGFLIGRPSSVQINYSSSLLLLSSSSSSSSRDTTRISSSCFMTMKPDMTRREALSSIMIPTSSSVMTAALLVSSPPAFADIINNDNDSNDDICGLEDIQLGDGHWMKQGNVEKASSVRREDGVQHVPPPPATFCTYASRFLLNYDASVSAWWTKVETSYSLLPDESIRRSKLGNSFGHFARSVQLAIDTYLVTAAGAVTEKNTAYERIQQGYTNLLKLFLMTYGNTVDAKRHIGLLFATLPEEYQPLSLLDVLSYGNDNKQLESSKKNFLMTTQNNDRFNVIKSNDDDSNDDFSSMSHSPPQSMLDDYTALLPDKFLVIQVKKPANNQNNNNKSRDYFYTIHPPISLYEVGMDEEFGQTATATMAGPLATMPLTRDIPDLSVYVYTLLGLSGAVGCALTHSIVIPLDVLKTRAQTDRNLNHEKVVEGGGGRRRSTSLLDRATTIVKKEGLQGLFLGAQATIAGYMWYGLSVYPSYTFFKRWIGQSLLSPEMAMIHANDIALVSGALAAVIASLGLTPIEAARIRTVADPDVYRSKGLLGTLDVIRTEDTDLGWRTLYAGLPSLLARQVIFGSIKFLAFERACEVIFKTWPMLHDVTWTSLMVSLVAGGFSGTLSSVVSQPADSVLTYVAQNSNLGLLDGSRTMVEEEGFASLFRGLSSRCVWAGSIIAGQFLLYDIFRTLFGVSQDDLTQIYEVIISTSHT